jgi:hypothetical protein
MVSVHILLRRDMARSLRHRASLCLSFAETMSEPTYIDGSRGHGLDVAGAYSSNNPCVYCEAGRRRRRGRRGRSPRRIQHFCCSPRKGMRVLCEGASGVHLQSRLQPSAGADATRLSRTVPHRTVLIDILQMAIDSRRRSEAKLDSDATSHRARVPT